MRLHTLFETSNNDVIFLEFDDISIQARLIALDENTLTVEVVNTDQENIAEATEILNEFIPLLIGAASLGMSAYDAYNAYKDYKAGKITSGDLAKQVGTDAALNIVGGGIAKGVAKGAQLAGRGIKSAVSAIGRKLAPAVTPAAAQVDNMIAKQVAKKADDIPTKSTKRRSDFDYDGNTAGAASNDDLQQAVKHIARFENTYIIPRTSDSQLVKESHGWNYKGWHHEN